ncbi:dihydrodipicolinate synthetase family protein [Colletotrichum scovillei]|uniref:Dihydrodipicolinate synthetase family protein n=1 Tax=Colletotrichum scovillei TaxID=1209932 RepID=A0A9P7UFL6_9PEZI|nr:dihydrodipicolinate synthetase family protein [Colletotrichum scovillei]KAG7069863.1 dihydrodipicolinate synthetase family protein [Colletotrichum scovillei]KAG7073814.1 dihydrodipicolinate synthetase family protein [Colletotrichum scovillei]
MTMAMFTSYPPEIIARVLASCDSFNDAFALASSCQYTYAVWLDHGASIIHSIGPRTIPAYEHAVVAVRATNTVKEAFHASQLPPNMTHDNIEELKPSHQKCRLSELADLLAFCHLAACLEYAYFHFEEDGYTCLLCPEIKDVTWCTKGDTVFYQRFHDFQEKFHRVLYKNLLAGAFLWKSHNELFIKAAADGAGKRFLEELRSLQAREDWQGLSDDSQAYIAEFPVYDVHKMTSVSQEKVFGHLARYLIQDIALVPDPACAAEVPWEVMASIYAHEYHSPQFFNAGGERRHGWPPFKNSTASDLPPTRKVTVVLFGEFQLEEVSMPINIEDMHRTRLVATQLQASSSESAEDGNPFACHGIDIAVTLRDRYMFLGGEEELEDCAPHPPLQLYTFMLKKHYGLEFSPGVFDRTYEEGYYLTFLWETIFGHDYHTGLDPSFSNLLNACSRN